MADTELLQLREEVEIFPVSELAPELRRRLGGTGDEVAVSCRRSRHATSLVDPATADLLRCFRSPTSLAAAARVHGRAYGEDPTDVLTQAWGVLEALLARGFLLRADDPRALAPLPLAAGDEVAGWTVVRPIQCMDDTEVYLARAAGRHAGIKIRCGGQDSDRRAIEREAAISEHLAGGPVAVFLGQGTFEERPFLLLEWFPGIDAEAAARRLREGHGSRSRRRLHSLVTAVARAYAEIHARGVLHADVHPRNLLVGRQFEVRILDFGLGAFLTDRGVPLRGGIPFFYAPETARALLEDREPVISAVSEQYSIAAVVYRLITGHHYCDFQLELSTQLRQVAEAKMTPFRYLDVAAWPVVEGILERALAPDPAERFADMDELARALAAAGGEEPPRSSRRARSRLAQAERRLLADASLDGAWWRREIPPPTASVKHGAAGVALACYRMACQREDAGLFALADLWIRRSLEPLDEKSAFDAPDRDLTEATVGRSSPYHTESGVHAVEALIAHAGGGEPRQQEAVRRFLAASERPAHGLDVTLGLAGTLVAGAALLDTLAGDGRETLAKRGDTALDELWRKLDAMPAITASEVDNLGIAHGWAGFLFATLRWREAAGGTLPASLAGRLVQLAELAEPWGRGLRWPWQLGPAGCFGSSMPGWCNGSAGHVFLWTLASRFFDEPRFSDLAEGAARDAWDAQNDQASLCCGLAGRVYALLALYRTGGGSRWLRRARDLAELAARRGGFGDAPPHALFKGEIILALLAADLERPEGSAFPFFEDEGWRHPRPSNTWRTAASN